MEVAGRIKVKNVDIQVSANFKKSELVVTTNEQYPQDIKIEFHQDKCDLVDPYKIGDEVEIAINLRGREWVNPQGESVFFNTIVGWRIKRPDTSKQTPVPAAPAATPQQAFAPADPNDDEPDDLPF